MTSFIDNNNRHRQKGEHMNQNDVQKLRKLLTEYEHEKKEIEAEAKEKLHVLTEGYTDLLYQTFPEFNKFDDR